MRKLTLMGLYVALLAIFVTQARCQSVDFDMRPILDLFTSARQTTDDQWPDFKKNFRDNRRIPILRQHKTLAEADAIIDRQLQVLDTVRAMPYAQYRPQMQKLAQQYVDVALQGTNMHMTLTTEGAGGSRVSAVNGQERIPPGMHKVTYRVIGIADTAALTLANESGGTEQHDVTLPWEESFYARPGQFVSLICTAQHRVMAAVTVAILIDGTVFKTANSSGQDSTTASCSGSVPR